MRRGVEEVVEVKSGYGHCWSALLQLVPISASYFMAEFDEGFNLFVKI